VKLGYGSEEERYRILPRPWGAIVLTPYDAAPEPRNLRRLKAAVRTRWGVVPLLDMLTETARLGFYRAGHRLDGGIGDQRCSTHPGWISAPSGLYCQTRPRRARTRPVARSTSSFPGSAGSGGGCIR
jgi:hypothetical protein